MVTDYVFASQYMFNWSKQETDKKMYKETPNVQMHVKGINGKQVFYDELNLLCMDDQLPVLKWL